MEKRKRYARTCFSADVIKHAASEFDRMFTPDADEELDLRLSVALGEEEWTHESESEFFADYRRGPDQAVYIRCLSGASMTLQLIDGTTTLVALSSDDRSKIHAIFEVFDEHAPASRVPEPLALPPEKPVVFIGHGRTQLWRDLKDHLHEKHGYQVEAYEIGARAGHAIRDILEEMLDRSSFALLVLTGEDETADGSLRARQNVIHETGLFQGKLGFRRAVVLLEEGAEEFSNIKAIEQIRFSKGNIKETFGDVLATLKREFGVIY